MKRLQRKHRNEIHRVAAYVPYDLTDAVDASNRVLMRYGISQTLCSAVAYYALTVSESDYVIQEFSPSKLAVRVERNAFGHVRAWRVADSKTVLDHYRDALEQGKSN